MRISATTKTDAASPPELLEWDTEFWGLRVGRSRGVGDGDSLSRWALENTVGLMCLLIAADDPTEAQRAEDLGYRFMDVRATLARSTAPYPAEAREHCASDVPLLRDFASVSHRITRFYADPWLDDEACDRLYEQWVDSSCAGWADRVLVVEHDGQASGYITVHLLDEGTASIGLIAVSEGARRNGLGGKLVRSAIDYAHSQGRHTITVVTQGRNIIAQRLFQACGFRTTATELWYHRWYDDPPPPVRRESDHEGSGV